MYEAKAETSTHACSLQSHRNMDIDDLRYEALQLKTQKPYLITCLAATMAAVIFLKWAFAYEHFAGRNFH